MPWEHSARRTRFAPSPYIRRAKYFRGFLDGVSIRAIRLRVVNHRIYPYITGLTLPSRALRLIPKLRYDLRQKLLPWATSLWFVTYVKVLESLLAALRERCASLPDRRVGMNSQYTMKDIGMAAFSVFFMQNGSFLQHQKRLQEGQGLSNCQTLFNIEKIPTENHIREHLDGASPAHFDSNFSQAIRMFLAEDNLAAFRRLDGRALIALDGTEYFQSYKVHCSNCSHRVGKNEKKEYFHTFLGATLVAPGHKHVMPLPPEFITPQDGHDKQDCGAPGQANRSLQMKVLFDKTIAGQSISSLAARPATSGLKRRQRSCGEWDRVAKLLKMQRPSLSQWMKAICTRSLCEIVALCRGLRPFYAWTATIGTWEVS
jgi:hypothetical protein